jgi:hypothetical protein
VIDGFLDAAQGLLSPRGAAILFLAVIFVGIAIGVIMSFRRTGHVDQQGWLTAERITRAFERAFGIQPTDEEITRFRAAMLDDAPRNHPADEPHPATGKDGSEAAG